MCESIGTFPTLFNVGLVDEQIISTTSTRSLRLTRQPRVRHEPSLKPLGCSQQPFSFGGQELAGELSPRRNRNNPSPAKHLLDAEPCLTGGTCHSSASGIEERRQPMKHRNQWQRGHLADQLERGS